MAQLPKVWLERPVPPDLADEMHGAAVILGPGSEQDPFAGIDDAVGAVVSILEYGAAALERARRLRVICRTGIGVDKVDVAAATARGIAVCNTPDAATVSTAEHAVALILAAAKHITRSAQRLRAGEAEMYRRHEAIELAGKTLGLIGYGRIPRRVARAAHGLGMEVIAYDPYLAETAFAGSRRAATLAEVLAAADVVSVHVPLTAETRHLMAAPEFGAMKLGAVFVNTSRGGVVDQDALLAALDSGRLMSAGLDVTDPEPLPTDHPLLNRDDVVVTPHVATATFAGRQRIFRAAFAQAVQVANGERPPHLVNPEVWDEVVAAL